MRRLWVGLSSLYFVCIWYRSVSNAGFTLSVAAEHVCMRMLLIYKGVEYTLASDGRRRTCSSFAARPAAPVITQSVPPTVTLPTAHCSFLLLLLHHLGVGNASLY